MSIISASTTSTTGYVVTSDTTGTLVFRTGASPTTAMTLGSDQSVTFAGAQTYTGAATFTSGITVQGLTVGKGAGAISSNTAVGASALGGGSQSGASNTAVGDSALAANTSGNNNQAFGRGALTANTTGGQNVAVGRLAIGTNTTGSSNTGVGHLALTANTTGGSNTALGQEALQANTTANSNTAIGYQAGYQITGVGTENTCLGYRAGYGITTGQYNTFIGTSSGQSGTITGTLNTCVGIWSGASLTSGSGNTFVGSYGANGSGSSVTTGSKNTILGAYTGNQGSLDIRTANNYIVLSDGDGNPRAWWGANGAGTNWACAKSDGDLTMYYGPADLSPTATRSARLGFITTSVSKNWYIAHNWNITGALEFVQTTASGGSAMSGTPAFYLNSSGNGVFTGSLSKGSGSFRIDHPLPELEQTHHLVHSFIEGPQADLIYRGKINLVAGRAEVNIDLASGMTEGTFVALCREVQCFTTNESDWVHVRGSVSGNVLTIEAQDPAATSLISWMVIGERQDKHMIDTDWTNDNGKVIVEPLKPPKIERKENAEVQA